MNINIDFDKLKETAKDLAQTSVAPGQGPDRHRHRQGQRAIPRSASSRCRTPARRTLSRRPTWNWASCTLLSRGAAPEPAYAALCEKISQSQAKIEYNNERIADIKAAGNLSDEEIQDVEVDIHDAAAEDHADDSCDCGCGCGSDDEPQA